jgi:hypothetical protein
MTAGDTEQLERERIPPGARPIINAADSDEVAR